MPTFDSPQPTSVEARVAALEALVGQLTGTIGDQAETTQAALATLEAARQAGDGSVAGSVTSEIAARQTAFQAIDDRIGDEIQRAVDREDYLADRLNTAIEDAVDGAVTAVTPLVAQAQAAATQADAAAQAAIIDGAIFRDVAAGLAATAEGDYFSAYPPDGVIGVWAIRYKVVGSAAVEFARAPNRAAYDLVIAETNRLAYLEAKSRTDHPLIDLAEYPAGGAFSRRTGLPLLALRKDGTLAATLTTPPGIPFLSSRWKHAEIDMHGYVMRAIPWTGTPFSLGAPSGGGDAATPVYEAGPAGRRDIFALLEDGPHQLTSAGDNSAPVLSAGQVHFVRSGVSISRPSVALPAPGSRMAGAASLVHIPCTGQSLGYGTGSAATTLQPPVVNRLLTLDIGVAFAVADIEDVLTEAMVRPFRPLVANESECPCIQMTHQLNRLGAFPENALVLTSFHGRGGMSLANLSKGAPHPYYNNLITAVTYARAEAVALGLDYYVPGIDVVQGEADRNAAAGVYYATAVQLQADLEADINAITGRSDRIPLVFDQSHNWTAYVVAPAVSNVPLEQLQLAIDMPDRFLCAGSKSYLPTLGSDGIHMAAPESIRLGAQKAVFWQALLAGSNRLPLHVVSARRNGTNVRLQFSEADVVLDLKNIANPGNWGLRWIDSAASASIVATRLLGGGVVDLTLSNAPTGTGPKIGISDTAPALAHGGPLTGPRTNLRRARVDTATNGLPVYFLASPQQLAVITET